MNITDTLPPTDAVLVALIRPDGSEDVHPDLLIEDAHIHPAFRPEDVTDTVRRLLAERDERIRVLTDRCSEEQAAAADGDATARALRAQVAALQAEVDRMRERESAACQLAEVAMGNAARVAAERDALRARLDALMLEHCPDEMTPEQVAEWARHQVPIDAARGAKGGSDA